jgi:hypothetical protein
MPVYILLDVATTVMMPFLIVINNTVKPIAANNAVILALNLVLLALE